MCRWNRRGGILHNLVVVAAALLLVACGSSGGGGSPASGSPSTKESLPQQLTVDLPSPLLAVLRQASPPALRAEAHLDDSPPGSTTPIELKILALDKDAGRVTLEFPAPLAAGQHTLVLLFSLQTSTADPLPVAQSEARTITVDTAGLILDFNAVTFDLTLDSDGDGYGNLLELRAQADPRVATSIPLVVQAVAPADGRRGVGIDARLRVTFNIEPAAIDAAALHLAGPAGEVVGDISVSGNDALFTPQAPLLPATRYTVDLAAGINSLAGTLLADAYHGSFTTAATAPLQLAAADLPYHGSLAAGAVLDVQINGLPPGSAYILTLGDLNANLDLAVFGDATFSAADCDSRHGQTEAESCGALADAGGSIYLQVEAAGAAADGQFTLQLAAVSGLLVNGRYRGATGLNTQHFMIDGLTPGAPTLVELSELAGGNADLAVYSDVFNSIACRSRRGAKKDPEEIQVLMANEGCVAAANAQGRLYVEVAGIEFDPWDNAIEIGYTLSYGAPRTVDVSSSLPLRQEQAVQILDYYKVSGLAANGRYAVAIKTDRQDINGSSKFYSYNAADFSSDHLTGCSDTFTPCTAQANAAGEIYLAVDRVQLSDTAPPPAYEFNVLPWQPLSRAQLPYHFMTGGEPQFLRVSGLDKAFLHRGMLRNDDPEAGLVNGLHATIVGIYTADDLSSRICDNGSVNACALTLDDSQAVPTAGGDLYVYLTTHTAMVHPHTFTVAPNIGVGTLQPLPYNGTVPKGASDYIVNTDRSKLGFILSGMSDNADLQVYYRSLAVTDCQSARGFDTAGQVAVDFCAIYQGSYYIKPEVFLVRVNAVASASGTPFNLATRAFYPTVSGANSVVPRAFGDVTQAGTPTSDFNPLFTPARVDSGSGLSRKGIWAGDGYHFYEIWSLHPGDQYQLTISATLATAPVTVRAAGGAVNAEQTACGSGTPCTVTADAAGTIRVALAADPGLSVDAPYSLSVALAGTPSPMTETVATVNGAATLVNQMAGLYLSRYYRLTGLTPGQRYDIAAVRPDGAVLGNADLYVYLDASFSTYAAGCAFALHADAATETCPGAVANGAGELYVRVYGNHILNMSYFDTGYTLTVAPSP